MAELDAEEEPEIVATFTSGPNTRVGTIPVTYDAQRKKMLWYYFMAASMKEKEMVRPQFSHASPDCMLSVTSACMRATQALYW